MQSRIGAPVTAIFRTLLRSFPLSRGKLGLAQFYFRKFGLGEKSRVLNTKAGVSFQLDLKDRIQALYYLTDLYEPETVAACVSELRATPSTYIDVGGNVGLLGLQVLGQRPATRAHFFEADPEIFKSLQTNVGLNTHLNIHLNHAAVDRKSGESLLFHRSHDPLESGWGRIAVENLPTSTTVSVSSVSLDDYIAKHGIQTVDLLKIDVEGAEERVLGGAENALRQKIIKSIIIELNDPALKAFGSSASSITFQLQTLGYKKVRQFELNALFRAT